MTEPHAHATHPALVARLKRADGHLRAAIDMIEAGKPCLEIAQQLQAVETAVVNAKGALAYDHPDLCLDADHLRAFITDSLGATAHIKRNPTRNEDRPIDWVLYIVRGLPFGT